MIRVCFRAIAAFAAVAFAAAAAAHGGHPVPAAVPELAHVHLLDGVVVGRGWLFGLLLVAAAAAAMLLAPRVRRGSSRGAGADTRRARGG